jgi:hypothetical protein
VLTLHGRPVASVEPDGTLLRWARPHELLRNPRGWAFSTEVLARAHELGAHQVRVICRDGARETVYSAPLAEFEAHGLPIDRGHGPQVALTLDRWAINGRPPRAQVVHRGEPEPEPEPAAVQLSMFSEGR